MTNAELDYRYKKQLDEESTVVRIRVFIENPETSVSKAGILYFRYIDIHGNDLAVDEKFVVSNRFGPYSYVTTVEGKTEYIVDVPVPTDAFAIEVGLADGAAKVAEKATVKLAEQGPNSETDFDDVSPTRPIGIDGIRATFAVESNDSYQLSWEIGEAVAGKALFLFTFIDGSGKELLPTGEFPIHAKLGPYKYVGQDSPDTTTFTAPPGAVKVLITGRQWSGQAVRLVAKPRIANVGDAKVSASSVTEEWLGALNVDDNLLILHSTAGAISMTNKLLLRSNRTALEMSRRGWKVIYVPFGTPADSDRLINDQLLQIPGRELVEMVDKLVAKELVGKRVFICSSHSDMMAISIQNRLQDYGWKTVYEIRDDMEEFRRVGYSKWYSQALELRFATEADALIATSPRLRDKLATMTGRQDIKYLPNAAPDELIENTAGFRNMSHLSRFRDKPIVGYLGHLTGSWFDWQKFIEVVRRNPKINFEIIGHGMPDGMRLPLNVKYYGPMSHEECLPFVSNWTVGLIPFIESRLTYGVDPNKVYEYVAMGLQTVSSPMGDLKNVPGVHLYRSTDEFDTALNDAIRFSPTNEFYNECNSFLETASWKYRVEEISEFVGGI